MNEPKEIYLQPGEDYDRNECDFLKCFEPTWCAEKIFKTDIGPYRIEEDKPKKWQALKPKHFGMNGISVYCKSMGKVFKVVAIVPDIETANKLCDRPGRDWRVIAEDNNGLIYLAEIYGRTVKADLLP